VLILSEYESLEAESSKLSDYESQFWREYDDYARQLAQVTEEQSHMKTQIANANAALERMKRTNVFDDAFHISHDGHFPTINGFRLGRLPAVPVDWSETSAGLGQVLLLLHTMARHTNYKFLKYRLMPMGSYSKMARLDDLSTTYELYGSNDLMLGRLFWYRRFDTALVWLLACIHEFGAYAQTFDEKFQLKYDIRGDLIGDVSIKLQFNNDAKWTKALKYMLVDCRQLLAWCANPKCTAGR
jgi:beclin 1